MNLFKKIKNLFSRGAAEGVSTTLPSINESTSLPTLAVGAQSKTYYLDDDAVEHEKRMLAQRIGQKLLDLDLIDYRISKMHDTLGGKVYKIKGMCEVVDISKIKPWEFSDELKYAAEEYKWEE